MGGALAVGNGCNLTQPHSGHRAATAGCSLPPTPAAPPRPQEPAAARRMPAAARPPPNALRSALHTPNPADLRAHSAHHLGEGADLGPALDDDLDTPPRAVARPVALGARLFHHLVQLRL